MVVKGRVGGEREDLYLIGGGGDRESIALESSPEGKGAQSPLSSCKGKPTKAVSNGNRVSGGMGNSLQEAMRIKS